MRRSQICKGTLPLLLSTATWTTMTLVTTANENFAAGELVSEGGRSRLQLRR